MESFSRESTPVEAIIPSTIYALDLHGLSDITGISEKELVHGMHDESARQVEGVVTSDEGVVFEGIHRQGHDLTDTETRQVRQALVTAAARPNELDTFDLPKCLITIGGKTIISHIISHLYACGIHRVVITVSHCGDQVIEAVKTHPMFDKIKIEFLDLGSDNLKGHARGILAAKHLFDDDFLLHTVDHVFDNEILRGMVTHDLCGAAACVLVDKNLAPFGQVELAKTAVKVQLNGSDVVHIGRHLNEFNAIEAGLFYCTPKVFQSLEKIAEQRPYFSLADALEDLAQGGKVIAVDTHERKWHCIETENQLSYTVENRDDSVFSPWKVFHAKPTKHPQTPFATSLPAQRKTSILFGISRMQKSSGSLQILRDEQTGTKGIFSGFVVGVGHVNSSVKPTSRSWIPRTTAAERIPLLSKSLKLPRTPPITPSPQRSEHDPLVVSIPVDDDIPSDQNKLDHSYEAYLIQVPQPDEELGVSEEEVILAVPDRAIEKEKPALLELPSDITGVKVQTCGPEFDVEVVVNRQVPVIGYALLIASLVALASVGAAQELQNDITPFLRAFWRMTATSIAFFFTALPSLWSHDYPPITFQLVVDVLLCSVAYLIFSVSFIIACDMTSLGDAYIFNNAHPLLIVIGKLVQGIPVARMEGGGTLIGLIGGVICSFDQGSNSTLDPSSPLLGDFISFIGSFGGVGYLLLAKKLRSKLNLYIFMWILQGSGALLIGLYLFAFDAKMMSEQGWFGWTSFSPNRLPVELYFVFVCGFIGIMGYVAVMKYFDPIVVSVVMLLEPILGSIIGIIIGVAGIPGVDTFIGAAIVIVGTGMVIVSQNAKTEAIKIPETVLTPRSTYGSNTPANTPPLDVQYITTPN